MSKVSLRQKFLQMRRSISEDDATQRSLRIREILGTHLSSKNFNQILVFTQHENEPDVKDIISKVSNCLVAMPVVSQEQGHMEFYEWKQNDRLVKNRYGILEPDPSNAQKILMTDRTLCLVPALAVTVDGERLGFGGGYYDRFLHSNPSVATLGVVFSEFIVDQLPTESHDRMLGGIVSELGVLQVSNQ